MISHLIHRTADHFWPTGQEHVHWIKLICIQ